MDDLRCVAHGEKILAEELKRGGNGGCAGAGHKRDAVGDGEYLEKTVEREIQQPRLEAGKRRGCRNNLGNANDHADHDHGVDAAENAVVKRLFDVVIVLPEENQANDRGNGKTINNGKLNEIDADESDSQRKIAIHAGGSLPALRSTVSASNA